MTGREPPGPDQDDWFAEPSDAQPRAEDEELLYEETEEDWLATGPPPRKPQARWPLTPAQSAVVAAVVLIAIVVIALAAAGVFSGGSSGTATTTIPTTTSTTPTTTTQPTTTTTVEAPSTTLAPGDQGPEVETLQRALASLGYSPGTIDGDYGPSTQAAVEEFQTASGLDADGVLGEQTLSALMQALSQSG